MFRVLRRYLASDRGDDALDVFILSAEHGLIGGGRCIEPYDRRMTVARAHELRPAVIGELMAQVRDGGPVDVLLCCSRTYLMAFDGCQQSLPKGSTVRHAPPRPGERLAYLHDWLYGRPPVTTDGRLLTASRPVSVRLRHVQTTLSAHEVLEQGRRALETCDPANARPVTWTVDLNGAGVSPKWLISTCFGLPHSAFGTSDALRVLGTLGISVRRSQD